MPEVKLSLPILVLLIILLVGLGAGAVYLFARSTPQIVVDFTATVTRSPTATITVTPTATATGTPVPTATPLPPKEYVVKAQDTCSKIAILFNVSIPSIVLLNNLPADCGTLSVGQKLIIPQPTPTASPQPTSTQNAVQATDKACEIFKYTVKDNDTLGGISTNYNVPPEAIKEYNGMSSDIVFVGQELKIPLCRRRPTPGPTPTSTPPPPYAAPVPLLPVDGAAFMSSSDVITLQWSSVGTLRQNEAYAVTVENLTEGTGRKLVEYVTDTKFIVPTTFRPSGSSPHIMRWFVVPVRQSGTTKDGQPIYEQGGAASVQRVFSWVGGGSGTPQP